MWYQCGNCGKKFEAVTVREGRECPECGQTMRVHEWHDPSPRKRSRAGLYIDVGLFVLLLITLIALLLRGR